jgi:large subunit ribosomal protein L16
LESAQKAIILKIKKKGKMWTRIFPNIPITSKSIGIRMGKGKGQISHWGTRVCGGNIIFELCSTNLNLTFTALKTGGSKLPIKTKIIN